jgi:Glutathione S-transferase, N-terminal domain
MAVKLLRCKNVWVKMPGHPCWTVQKALDEQGIDYEVVRLPWPGGDREEMVRITGQKKYPAIQFEDGSVYRQESKDMAKTIKAGKLFDRQASQGSPEVSQPTST